MKISDCFSEVAKLKDELINDRRHFHKNPETGFDTENTESYIRERLRSLDIDIISTTVGVCGFIPGKTRDAIALRADIDALNVKEETGLAFSSQIEGKMHACGHDAHTAMLLTACKAIKLNEGKLSKSVYVFFQPAEEGPNLGGARIMIDDFINTGMIDDIKEAYALHVTPDLLTGQISLISGPVMASTDEFTVEIIGKGGHPSTPHLTVDAISVANKAISALESYVSRQTNPLDQKVISVGIIRGGTGKNIISPSCIFEGTIRNHSEITRQKIKDFFPKLLDGLKLIYDCEYKLDMLHGLPVLSNDETCLRKVESLAVDQLGHDAIVKMDAQLGAEDFAYFAERIPSGFVWIGVGHEEKSKNFPLHNGKFNLNENGLILGSQLLTSLAFSS